MLAFQRAGLALFCDLSAASGGHCFGVRDATAPAKILQGTTGFTPSDYDTRILFPVMKKALSSRSTGLQVQNVDAASVGVTMVYYGAGGTCPSGAFTETVRTLAPGKQSTTYLDPAILPAGRSATCSYWHRVDRGRCQRSLYPGGSLQGSISVRPLTLPSRPTLQPSRLCRQSLSKTLAASGLA